jgi:hypothetical protein
VQDPSLQVLYQIIRVASQPEQNAPIGDGQALNVGESESIYRLLRRAPLGEHRQFAVFDRESLQPVVFL